MRSEYILNLLVATYVAEATYMSFHDGDPGTTGENELAIPREPLTWSTPVIGGSTADPVEVVFPADTVVTSVGFWTASTGGTYVDSIAAVGDFAVAGTYEFTPEYFQE